METNHAVEALAALAHPVRLSVFRLLMQAGPRGLPAGRIAEAMSLPPSSLSFHLKELQHAGLLGSEQQGRSILYMARYETMNALLVYLTDDCCGGNPCTPLTITRTSARATAKVATKVTTKVVPKVVLNSSTKAATKAAAKPAAKAGVRA